jgi:hypothetical protein
LQLINVEFTDMQQGNGDPTQDLGLCFGRITDHWYTHRKEGWIPLYGPYQCHSSLLQVNREARSEAFKVQQRYYIPPAYTPRIHAHLGIDTLWIPEYNRSLLEFSDATDSKAEVQRLALDFTFFEQVDDRLRTMEQLIQYPNLKELYLIFNREKLQTSKDVIFIKPRESAVWLLEKELSWNQSKSALTWQDVNRHFCKGQYSKFLCCEERT